MPAQSLGISLFSGYWGGYKGKGIIEGMRGMGGREEKRGEESGPQLASVGRGREIEVVGALSLRGQGPR